MLVIGLAIVLALRQPPDQRFRCPDTRGLAFRIKPLFAWARAIALPAYIIFFVYMMSTQKRPIPWWMALLFVAAIGIGLIANAGDDHAHTDGDYCSSFWFQPSKAIQYNEVMAIQAMQGGRMTRVLGDNRVKITHTSNHCAAAEFQQELERRTGKRVIA